MGCNRFNVAVCVSSIVPAYGNAYGISFAFTIACNRRCVSELSGASDIPRTRPTSKFSKICPKSTAVVNVRMRQHHHVEPPNPAKIEIRFNNTLAYVIIHPSLFLIIVICALNTTVNQQRSIVWKANESRVALSNVERDHFQQFALFVARSIPKPRLPRQPIR